MRDSRRVSRLREVSTRGAHEGYVRCTNRPVLGEVKIRSSARTPSTRYMRRRRNAPGCPAGCRPPGCSTWSGRRMRSSACTGGPRLPQVLGGARSQPCGRTASTPSRRHWSRLGNVGLVQDGAARPEAARADGAAGVVATAITCCAGNDVVEAWIPVAAAKSSVARADLPASIAGTAVIWSEDLAADHPEPA